MNKSLNSRQLLRKARGQIC